LLIRKALGTRYRLAGGWFQVTDFVILGM